MAERQAHVTTDKKTELTQDLENKEKQFQLSWKNGTDKSVSAIEKDAETTSKHCSFENQSGMINDLGLRVKHPLKASVITAVDQSEIDASYRDEVNVDLREPRVISGTSVLALGKKHSRNKSTNHSLGGRGRYHDMTLEQL